MTDEVPTNRRTARRHLAESLLNAVFADVLEARVPRSYHRFRPMRFGDGDDPNLLAMPAAAGGFADPLPNLGETVGQVLKWHNALSYQGLQIESRETPRPLLASTASNFAGHCSMR